MKFPFEDTPDTACIVCKHVLSKEKPILFAARFEDDGMWEFLCGGEHDIDDAKIISLYEAFTMDESIGQLADMPYGCYVEREKESDDWR